MPRDFAAVNLAIWQDPDWRDLPADAKLLYLTLWAHPQLTRAGVVDWRPGRLAALIDNTWTAKRVRAVADCLEARLFIVTDEQTEECLIRSWVRFDGLMKSPVMAVTFANEYAAIVSTSIRGVIVHELHKLRDREPGFAAWGKDRVLEVLNMPSLDPRARELPTDPLTPAVTPAVTRSSTVQAGGAGNPSDNHPPTPAPAPTPFLHTVPDADASDDDATKTTRRKPERPLPDSWKPTTKHYELAQGKRVDIATQVTAFRNHAQTHDRRARDWDAAFRTWLNKARPSAPAGGAANDWMQST